MDTFPARGLPRTPDSPEKAARQAEILANRLAKQYRRLRKWARRSRVTCYRLYDRDIPEVPLAVDLYAFLPPDVRGKREALEFQNEAGAAISRGGAESEQAQAEERGRSYLSISLYERPGGGDAGAGAQWLAAMARAAAGALGIPEGHAVTSTRRRQSGGGHGRESQYERRTDAPRVTGTVFEQGQLFSINLGEYIDTGLFLDHRPLRALLRERCRGKSVLNLFCYTGGFSVYAAEGLARLVDSVDLSNTYLDWAAHNMRLNGFTDAGRYRYVRSDAVDFLRRHAGAAYDIIMLDPPTFSNSKNTPTLLDTNRDWPELVALSLRLLAPGGTLYFSTNSRRLRFDAARLPPGFGAEDITAATIPEDFRNARIHRAWEISRPR